MTSAAPYLCPAGFDCAVANSCPNFVLNCPPGFFCSSFEGHKHQKLLDFQYASFKSDYLSADTEVTMNNADTYAEAGRYVSVNCLSGFSCPDSNSIGPCAAGEWCPETALGPIDCDGLSACGATATFQVNFVIPLIAVLMTAIALFVSFRLTNSQTQAELRTRGQPLTLPSVDAAEGSVHVDEELEIIYQNVVVTTPIESDVILNNLSGHINARSLFAVMGPTGCGKSSLINSLRGVGNEMIIHGKVQIRRTKSGEIVSPLDLPKYVGYVPQQDIMDRTLTVRELLVLHAMLRADASRSEAILKTETVLSDLHIQHIGDTIIGGSETTPANISGGQLKRVNIACELVSLQRPAVLFLDEPTAGLDASIARELILLLKNLTKAGVLVVLAVQQPRPEIFHLFSSVMLMLDGGNVAFDGKPSDVLPYLSSMGYEPTGEEADADFCVDVLNNIIAPINKNAKCACAADLAEQWRKGSAGMTSFQISDDAETGIILKPHQHREKVFPESELLVNGISVVNDMKKTLSSFDRKKFSKQVILSIERQVLTSLRNRKNLYVYIGLQVSGAIFLSVAFSPLIQGSYLGTYQMPASEDLAGFLPAPLSKNVNTSDIGFKQLLFFLSSVLGAMTALCAVPLFSGRVSVIKREAQTGVSALACGIGFMIFDLVIVIWMAVNLNAAWMLFGHAGHFYHWFLVIIGTSFAASGIGYMTGVSVPPMTANTVAVVSSIIFAVFSGVEPTLRQLSDLNILNTPWYISYATWTAEAAYYTWTQYMSESGIDNEERVQRGADHYGYEVSSLGRAIGCLVALGIGFRLIALYLLVRRTK